MLLPPDRNGHRQCRREPRGTFGHKPAVDAHISSGMETELLSGTKRKCSARLNHKTVENLYRFRAFPNVYLTEYAARAYVSHRVRKR